MKLSPLLGLGLFLALAYLVTQHRPVVAVAARTADESKVAVGTPISTAARPESKVEPPPPPVPGKRASIATAADVLNLAASADTRAAALHQLTQMGARATEELKRVATTPLPTDLARVQTEIAFRITAMEALDQLAVDGVNVGDAFAVVFAAHQDKALETIAMVGLRGIEQGRPGKIKRFIDEMVN